MDIYEFELRHKSYAWLSTRLKLWRDDEIILQLIKKTKGGQLEDVIQKTTVDDLHTKTKETYTSFKKSFIEQQKWVPTISASEQDLSEYIERLEYEFKVIHEMWYNTYFLIVEDYIWWSKDNDIVVWPWRWSCAGSLLSYVIWITDIDPLEYDLIFERFLNPARISMPDIDTDFEDTQRQKVIQYMSQKYGADKVAHIWTYMKLAAKAAFKDVARVFGVKFADANKLTNMITEKTVPKSVEENEDLQKAIANDNRLKKIIDIATRIEWTVRQTWVHACGMIIAPEQTHTYSVIQHPPKAWSWGRDFDRVVSQYDWWTIEDIWLLKMDVLGLRNLSIIKNTIKILNAQAKIAGKKLEPIYQEFLDTMLFHPPLDDEYVYKRIFWKWDTSWVFQFESDGMKQRLKKLRATEFDDLIAMVSLYRPGPMEFIPNYIDRKHEVEKVSYMQSDLKQLLTSTYSEEVMLDEKKKLEEDLWEILSKTYGIAVYQEQLMRMSQYLSWFSMAEADKLRKWVGKKIKELIEKIKKDFVGKWVEYKDYKPETLTWVYEKMIEPAARYSFNKSHAACYAYISYQTAYLKAYHPIEFHAALLRSAEENTDRLAQFIWEIKMQWYSVFLPNINISYDHVAAIDGAIHLWFLSIKWVWSEVAATILQEREKNGPFTQLTDFLKRCKQVMNKKTLESLIMAWALRDFMDRHTLAQNVSKILDRVKSEQEGGQAAGLFAMTTVEWSDLTLTPLPNPGILATLQTEYTAFKTFVSWHPLDGLYPYIRAKYSFISMFKDVDGYGAYTCLWYIKEFVRNRWGEWFFMKIEDISWEVEFYIKDKLDLMPFMIVWISGYKWWRRSSIDQIIVYDLEALIEKAKSSSRYDETKTVSAVRADRFGSADTPPEKKNEKENIHPEDDIAVLEKINEQSEKEEKIVSKSSQENKQALLDRLNGKKKSNEWNRIKENIEVEDIDVEKTESHQWTKDAPKNNDMEMSQTQTKKELMNNKTIFETPENITLLMKIPGIVKAHPGEIEVHIWSMKKSVSEEGVEKLNTLLN